jgi:hypothetical protein
MVMLALAAAANLLISCASFLIHFPEHSYWNPPGAPVANLGNTGPHGLSEILYANASAVGTNGSALTGLNANTSWFNLTLGLEMLIGRFLVFVPALALAGNLAHKKRVPVTVGTMPTHGVLFVVLLTGTIVIVTALTFFPAGQLEGRIVAMAGDSSRPCWQTERDDRGQFETVRSTAELLFNADCKIAKTRIVVPQESWNPGSNQEP